MKLLRYLWASPYTLLGFFCSACVINEGQDENG